MKRRPRADQKRKATDETLDSQKQKRGGLWGSPRRNTDPYKEQMIQMSKEGMSNLMITEHLQATYGTDISYQTISRRLSELGLPTNMPKKGCGARTIRNINSHKDSFVAWEKEGLDIQALAERFHVETGSTVSGTTITNGFERWHGKESAPWRQIEEFPVSNFLGQALPVDLLPDAALDTLQQDIQTAYLAEASACEDVASEWVRYLVAAACYDRSILRVIVREMLQPGHHWSPDRLFNPHWVLGIYLPGSYCNNQVDTREKIMSMVDSVTPHVLEEVRSILHGLLSEVIVMSRTEDPEHAKAALSINPVTSPPQCIVDLLQVCDRETRVAELYNKSQKITDGLPRSGLADCVIYRPRQNQEAVSVMDTWTHEVCSALCAWQQPWMTLQPLPAFTDGEMQMIENLDWAPSDSEGWEGEDSDTTDTAEQSRIGGAGAREFDTERGDGDSNGGSGSEEDASDSAARGSDSGRGLQGDSTWSYESKFSMLHSRLARRVRSKLTPQPKVFKPWCAPTSGALLGVPPSRFGTAPWVPYPVSGFQAELEAVVLRDRYPKDTAAINLLLADVRRYLHDIITQQTLKEKAEYEAVCQRMCACTSRPCERGSLVGLWSELSRDNDWWHCRRLLQMLAARYPDLAAACSIFEPQLMLLLAAFEGGSTEGVMWIGALDGLLQGLTREVQRERDSTADNLMEELVIFAHGVALNNLILRCYTRRLDNNQKFAPPPWDVQAWYTMLYSADCFCASHACAQRLPHPRELITRVSSQLFSVGSKERRLGSIKTRSFISADMWEAYPCLVTWLRMREPHPALVVAFLWFARLYHSDIWCKTGQGKLAETF